MGDERTWAVALRLSRELTAMADEKGKTLGVKQLTRGSDHANDLLLRLARAALRDEPEPVRECTSLRDGGPCVTGGDSCPRCGRPFVSPVPSTPGEPSEEAVKAAMGEWRSYYGEMGFATVMQAALRAAYAVDGLPSPPGPVREEPRTISLPDAGYWLYARGIAVPPGDPNWGSCQNCIALPEPCFSCSMRADVARAGPVEAALPHEFVETDPVSVQPNPAQTSEVEAVAGEMRDYTDHVRVAERPSQRTLDGWADRLSPSRGAEEER